MADEVKNPSFEDPGIDPGQADQWTEAYDLGAEDYAVFGIPPGGTAPFPFEDYEEWNQSQHAVTSFPANTLYPALFERGTLPRETFDYSWCSPAPVTIPPRFNHLFLTAFNSGDTETAPFALTGDREHFEYGWLDNQNFETSYGAGGATSSAALFDSGADSDEDFENAWGSNENYQTSFGPGDTSLASFDSMMGAQDREIFDTMWDAFPT